MDNLQPPRVAGSTAVAAHNAGWLPFNPRASRGPRPIALQFLQAWPSTPARRGVHVAGLPIGAASFLQPPRVAGSTSARFTRPSRIAFNPRASRGPHGHHHHELEVVPSTPARRGVHALCSFPASPRILQPPRVAGSTVGTSPSAASPAFNPRASRGPHQSMARPGPGDPSTPARRGVHAGAERLELEVNLQPPRVAGSTCSESWPKPRSAFNPRASRGPLATGLFVDTGRPSTPARRGVHQARFGSLAIAHLQPPRVAGSNENV